MHIEITLYAEERTVLQRVFKFLHMQEWFRRQQAYKWRTIHGQKLERATSKNYVWRHVPDVVVNTTFLWRR